MSVYKSTGQLFLEDAKDGLELELQFSIERVLFRKNSFTIVKARVFYNDQRVLFPQNKAIIKGSFSNPRIGDYYNASGIIKKDKKNGHSVAVSGLRIDYPREQKDVIKFLIQRIPSVGKKTAELIVKELGSDCLAVLAKNPTALQSVNGLKSVDRLIQSFKKELIDGESLNKLLALLSAVGIHEGVGFSLYEEYGTEAFTELVNNPFILVELDPLLYKQAERLAKEQARYQETPADSLIEKESTIRKQLRAELLFFLKKELELTGSLLIKKGELYSSFEEKGFYRRMINGVLSDLEETNRVVIIKGETEEDDSVYSYEAFVSEERLTRQAKRFIQSSVRISTPELIDEFVSEYEAAVGFRLADKQKEAVSLLADNRFSILTGGPGSGKTTTIKAIHEFLLFLERKGLLTNTSVALLAPTGKAAGRLSEVLGLPASTIHRKLKLKGFGAKEEPAMITEAFVIIDESSMIDVHLFSTLLSCIELGSRVLVVGDQDQLPSIGPGLVFRDLIDSNKVPLVKLDKTFRQGEGSQLIKNARLMREGIGYNPNEYPSLTFSEKAGGDSYFIEQEESVGSLKAVQAVVHSLISKKGISLDELLVLSAKKEGVVGTNQLNSVLQQTYNGQSKDYVIRKSDNVKLSVGDPVIQLINDYDKRVYNGDRGVIESIVRTGKSVFVVCSFNNGEAEEEVYYSEAEVDTIALAYAITYHKSQGSEANYVVCVVDKEQQRQLNRSLVYTGYTRSKRFNCFVGQYDSLNKAIQTTDNLKRKSLIKDKL